MIKGTVVFQMANIGSKSEGCYPFLRLEDGKLVKIVLRGDNPFENNTLKEYDGKMVELEGDYNENGKFIATEIAEVVTETCETEDETVDTEAAEESGETPAEKSTDAPAEE